MCDIDGLLTTTRKIGNLEGHKKFYAKNHPPVQDLGQVVKEIKPSVCNQFILDSSSIALSEFITMFPSKNRL